MVNSLRLAGLDRGEWILTAYFVVLAASGVLPLALVAVELLPQSGGAVALALVAVTSALAGLVVWRGYSRVLPIRANASGRLARRLGIPFASRWLMHGTSLRALLQRHGSSYLTAATRRTLDDVVGRSEMAERAHVAGAAAVVPWVVAAWKFDAPVLAGVVAVIGAIFQIYPVLVQRETRRRVMRIARRRPYFRLLGSSAGFT